MANQAIALQARAPQQGNFLAPAIQQAGQIANRMAQQQALDRQTAVAQQQMDLAQTRENRDITQAKIDNDGKKIDFYTKRAGQTMNAAGYELLLRDMDKDAPEAAAAFRANLPLERFDRNELLKMVGSISDNFKATYGPLETQVVQLNNGDFAVTVTGGFGKPGVFELEKYSLRSGGAPPAAPTASPPAAGVPPMVAPQTPTAQPAPQTPTGGMFQRMSATGGQPQGAASQGADPLAPLLASLTEAKQTGQIGSDVVEQLRQLDPRITPDALDAILAQNGIKVAPGGGMRSAVYRGESPMAAQQVQFDPNAYVATGQTARGKPLMQSPTPGIYNVPAPQIAGAAAAEEGGKQGVRVATEPVIAGGKKKAELQAEKEIAFPDAQGQFESALTTIDNRLDYIKRFREHPARDRVIGPMDAFTPNIGRARGAQEIYNALVATATLDELQKMREASKTGGALGNVSDADIRILRQSIGALGQDQPEEDFKESLKIFESQLKQTRERLVRRYRENYGYKLGKSWNPPTFTARAKPAGGRSSGGFTVMEVED
jgi:hypothetical protein